ncbi:hypothetical protein POM88_045090 [Heracleum sosnowskyi]|uniref:Retrovirus-related Pol polyprotein from transposon TNT 1-94-like beta-barrel domain-containing protein n=1 Tax=Heracleum sosnowskyi TaxID=360622 RepID=A0AAD8M4L9_9APIA|nr:hypothetical protein POM88_045090 [Heracleum sosnowskyi]
MGHYAPECKKGKTGKALISKGKDWADTSDSDEDVSYALMATVEDESETSENKVPLTTYTYDTDNISELRIYLKSIHVSYRDQTLENERIKSENLNLRERNKFLEEELVNMQQVQKERDDVVYVEQELLKKFRELEFDLEKERKVIKTWTNSGKDTHQVFQTDTVGLGYCEEDELRFKDKVKVKTQLKPMKFVPESSKQNSVLEKEAVKKESVKTCVKQVNVGLMTEKQFKYKLKEGIRESTLVLDSGCSGHMTGNKALLSDYEEKAGPKVSYGDGNIGCTMGYGNINLGSVIITNVALVPGLKHDLLSVSQICDRVTM